MVFQRYMSLALINFRLEFCKTSTHLAMSLGRITTLATSSMAKAYM